MPLSDRAICNKKGAVSQRNSPSVGILLKMKGKIILLYTAAERCDVHA